MSDKDHVAKVSTVIDAPKEEVWEALTDPDSISQYMFGTKVNTDWQEGSPITWEGEWEGRQYQDKGRFARSIRRRSSSTAISARLPGCPMCRRITTQSVSRWSKTAQRQR